MKNSPPRYTVHEAILQGQPVFRIWDSWTEKYVCKASNWDEEKSFRSRENAEKAAGYIIGRK